MLNTNQKLLNLSGQETFKVLTFIIGRGAFLPHPTKQVKAKCSFVFKPESEHMKWDNVALRKNQRILDISVQC